MSNHRLLHVYRNTPYGRETLLQSVYFCKMIDASLVIYIPCSKRFLMYFENDVVQVDLDQSYLKLPETALERATSIARQEGLEPDFFYPKEFTASTLPDIPTNFDFMTCPRSMSDLSSKIGLDHIGPKVRSIIRAAHFPVLIPSPIYKEWHSLMVFFGGSHNAVNALRLGLRISRLSGVPLDIFTQMELKSKEEYEKVVLEANLKDQIEKYTRKWYWFTEGELEDNLFDVPHDALLILGAYGHGIIRELVFGSKMETIQSTLPNSLLIAGPRYTERRRG